MSDEIEIRDNEEEIVNEDNIIELTDEDGETVQFEFCASIEYEGKEYVVLLPMDEDDGEVVILEVKEDEEDSEEVTYIGVDDEDILEAVFELFKKEAADYYDFE